jgi:hypothetical protein
VTVHAGRFSERAAVITGGASGIGLRTAKRLLVEGRWFASDEMCFSTGAVFDVSGGRATY